jgi:hypothetical protein
MGDSMHEWGATVGVFGGSLQQAAIVLVVCSVGAVSACTINVGDPSANNGDGGSAGSASSSSSGSGGSSGVGSSSGGSATSGDCQYCPRTVPQEGATCLGLAACYYPQAGQINNLFYCGALGSSWRSLSAQSQCPATKPAQGSSCAQIRGTPAGPQCEVCEYSQGCNTPIMTMLCTSQGTWAESPSDVTMPRMDPCGQGSHDAGTSGPSTQSFTAQITIAGTSRSFAPRSIIGGFGTAGTQMHLPMAVASSGTSVPAAPNDTVVGILTNPLIVSGPGAYTTSPGSAQGLDQGGHGLYVDPQYKNADGSEVAFQCQPGGSLTITQYSTQLGGYLAGTFSCTLTGTQSMGMGNSRTVIGNMSGTFNVQLTMTAL